MTVMTSRSEIAQQYLKASTGGDVDAALSFLADDAVVNRNILGTFRGKEAIGEALRNQPRLNPKFEAPQEAGDQVRIKGRIPGIPVGALTWTFTFEGDKIKRIDVTL